MSTANASKTQAGKLHSLPVTAIHIIALLPGCHTRERHDSRITSAQCHSADDFIHMVKHTRTAFNIISAPPYVQEWQTAPFSRWSLKS